MEWKTVPLRLVSTTLLWGRTLYKRGGKPPIEAEAQEAVQNTSYLSVAVVAVRFVLVKKSIL